MKVSIIILVQDRYDMVQRCLNSIVKHTTVTDYELVLVLQAVKNERILDLISNLDCKKTIITNKVNNGVTPGRNQGIEASSGYYMLFFDDDAYIDERLDLLSDEEKTTDWLGRMIRHYDDPSVGIVSQSGSLINPNRMGVFWAVPKNTYCDVGQGYCFMFSKPVVDKIGLLDPYFGKFWHEESEYALRAKFHGFKVKNAGYIGVFHLGSGSGDDGTYAQKAKYMFDKWSKFFPSILERQDW